MTKLADARDDGQGLLFAFVVGLVGVSLFVQGEEDFFVLGDTGVDGLKGANAVNLADPTGAVEDLGLTTVEGFPEVILEKMNSLFHLNI
ncbi:hypothetical protein ACLBV5_09695 [Brevundimonas sp. M1A4_2e]